ncbi:MAG TPA: tetratricopeptide repeat protein, partial [Gallionella sp.]|nr:tetratricopeptide repeat protein [Gallionella sp.]
CSLGVALKELGQFDEAVTCFRRALEIDPGLVEAQTNLDAVMQNIFNIGNVLMGKGKLDEAVANYHRVLEIKSDFAEAHTTLGVALMGLGQINEAIANYRRALQIKPDSAETHCNLGVALKELGELDSAVDSFSRALQLNPDFSEAHSNLGNTLMDLGQFDNAAASCRQAIKIKPDFAEAYCNLGIALTSLGQLDDAAATFGMALDIKPDNADALSNLLLALNYTSNNMPAYYLEQARKYGCIVAAKVGARLPDWQCSSRPERLRVGLVSGDFRNHSVGHFLEGLLACIAPARIELIAYPTHHAEDELTARIRPYFSEWKPLVGKNNEAAARQIHTDGIHILVDLSGHTGHNRLPIFAWKPAPVQVSWLGLPTTTGVAAMDYVLGDPHAIPAEYENQFSETVWRIPDSYLCLTVPTPHVNVAQLPAFSSGRVTFGSFNNLAKMNDTVVMVWARILKSVPNSMLLLKAKQLGDPVVCLKTRQRFAACGIAPDRLQLNGILASSSDHLTVYNKVDIALDTFPYPGVTTSVEALWMGVPVLSQRGNSFLSCTAESIAHNAGLADWIAADEEDYVTKAITFSSNLEHLAALRAVLREQILASPLFDAPRFARNFEDALWGMWARYQAQQESSGKS